MNPYRVDEEDKSPLNYSLQSPFLDSADDKEEIEEERDDAIDGREIEPVSQMTIMNDNVVRLTNADGTPAPRVLEDPGKFDIVLWLPIFYISWSLGSLGIGCVLLMLDSSPDGLCTTSMTGWIVTMFILVVISSALATWATVWILREACC